MHAEIVQEFSLVQNKATYMRNFLPTQSYIFPNIQTVLQSFVTRAVAKQLEIKNNNIIAEAE